MEVLVPSLRPPGELVHGVIYKVLEKELSELDILESVPQGFYKREAFLVLREDGRWHRVDLDRVTDSRRQFPPARSYVEQMLTGKKQHGLDSEYIRKIKSFFKCVQWKYNHVSKQKSQLKSEDRESR